jgi:hypothetical protein
LFKKLLPLLFLFAGFQANAAIIQFQYDDTISYSFITGLVAGQSATITVGLDNGVAGDVSQIWTAGDLTSVTFDFNNGGLVTTFNSPWGGSLDSSVGNFTTNGSGVLTGFMPSWYDVSLGTDWLSSSVVVIALGWFLSSSTSAFGIVVDWEGLSSAVAMSGAGNWSKVAAVPEPSIIALFGLGLVGIGFARRKRQS